MSGMKLPFLMKGASRRYRINCVSAPASQKTGDKKLKHSERNHSKQETSSPSVEVAQEEVGQLERCICIWSGEG